jgi:hypothetical protein
LTATGDDLDDGPPLPRSISEWLDLWREEDEALGIFDDAADDVTE